MAPTLLTTKLNTDTNCFDDYKLERPLIISEGRNMSPNVSIAASRFINDRTMLIADVMAAARTGMFQVIDHGVPEHVMQNAMIESERFFDLPTFQINEFLPHVEGERMLYTSSMLNHYEREEPPHFWRDALLLNGNTPAAWPYAPPNFRPCVWEFASYARSVAARVLELIGEGIPEMGRNYFSTKRLNESAAILVNRYPRCPQPTWAWGMPPHGDPSLLTISMPADGLQILRGHEWKFVVPSSNALLVTVGRVLQFVSKDEIQAAEHRVVLNSERAQTSLSFFAVPKSTCMVQPPDNPTCLTISPPGPLYREFPYGEFFSRHVSNNRNSSSIIPDFRR